MRKLNQKQKEQILKNYGKVGYIVVMNTEKYGNENNTIEEDIDFAYDVMLQHAE